MKPHIRWLIRRDFSDVLRIENQSFQYPWERDDFLYYLRQHKCIGMVAEVDEQVVAFMLYELRKSRLDVINFAVDRSFRRQGIGSAMIEKLQGKLSADRRSKIIFEIRESNLGGQLFLKSQGFQATRIVKSPYSDTPEDAYRFEYQYQAARECETWSASRRS